MRRGLHLATWVAYRDCRSTKSRRAAAAKFSAKSRRLLCEPLEDRRLLSVFTVSNPSDGAVANPNDLPGSLRQAIYDANHTSGPDTIVFDASLDGGTISLQAGELAITDSVTIEASAGANITIDAAGQSRIFNIDDGNPNTKINVVIDGLALTGGYASGPTLADDLGGAIFSDENLTVQNSTITGNTAAQSGGGIWASANAGGTTTIANCTISANYASYQGGGVFVQTAGVGPTIQDSTISNNVAGQNGGGVAVWTYSGSAMIQRSTISGNLALGDGGGITLRTYGGSSTIQNSTVSGNLAYGNGGGVLAWTYAGGARLFKTAPSPETLPIPTLTASARAAECTVPMARWPCRARLLPKTPTTRRRHGCIRRRRHRPQSDRQQHGCHAGRWRRQHHQSRRPGLGAAGGQRRTNPNHRAFAGQPGHRHGLESGRAHDRSAWPRLPSRTGSTAPIWEPSSRSPPPRFPWSSTPWRMKTMATTAPGI